MTAAAPERDQVSLVDGLSGAGIDADNLEDLPCEPVFTEAMRRRLVQQVCMSLGEEPVPHPMAPSWREHEPSDPERWQLHRREVYLWQAVVLFRVVTRMREGRWRPAHELAYPGLTVPRPLTLAVDATGFYRLVLRWAPTSEVFSGYVDAAWAAGRLVCSSRWRWWRYRLRRWLRRRRMSDRDMRAFVLRSWFVVPRQLDVVTRHLEEK